MKIKVLLGVSALAVATALVTGSAFGETYDKRTVFTFNRPIALPGVTLPAGEYLFRIVNTETDRKVIQVLSGDGKKPYAMLHSIPDVRVQETEHPAVRFMETAKGQPSAVKAWWYPGERIGYEFIYPKDQARRLAREVREPVLTTVAETTKAEETSTAPLERITPTEETPVVAVPEPAPIQSAGIVQEGEIAEARTELPVTATTIPVFGAFGLLALALAGGVRLWRKANA